MALVQRTRSLKRLWVEEQAADQELVLAPFAKELTEPEYFLLLSLLQDNVVLVAHSGNPDLIKQVTGLRDKVQASYTQYKNVALPVEC